MPKKYAKIYIKGHSFIVVEFELGKNAEHTDWKVVSVESALLWRELFARIACMEACGFEVDVELA